MKNINNNDLIGEWPPKEVLLIAPQTRSSLTTQRRIIIFVATVRFGLDTYVRESMCEHNVFLFFFFQFRHRLHNYLWLD